MRDLKVRYQVGEKSIHKKLQGHIATRGRISLTTDAWAGNNKLDYSAVTGHWQTAAGEHHSILLDIIELAKPIHDSQYFYNKLLEITDRLSITCVILSITHDNASPNNIMLDEFETAVQYQYNQMDKVDQLYFCCKFNHKDGDIRYCAHTYNIGVQAALKAVK
jgi:hypothetical protein